MSYRSYIINKFEFTHENKFFREFSEKLDKIFSNRQGQHILVGNLSCDGHMIDAIFIAPGSISVIDFKDYGGELTISENNPWRIKTKSGEIVFVMGGAQNRNPLQQVKAYRRSLAEFLTSNQSEILDPNHQGVDWIHTGCIILFHNKVTFKADEIPSKMSRFLHVSDPDSVYNLLSDLFSSTLNLNDNEILRILKLFNINENNLLENYIFDEGALQQTIPNENRLYLIKQLLKQSDPQTEFGKILKYYHTLIDVERYNEPEATELATFQFNQDQDASKYIIQISTSRQFHERFVKNFREEKWPKNVFIALNLFIEGKGIPLLHTLVMASDISNHDEITINLDEFSIYQKPLEKMGLSEDIIEELISAVNEKNTLNEKIEAIRNVLGIVVELTKAIQVGLSTESLYTVQLASELKGLAKKEKESRLPALFESFVYNKGIHNSVPKLKLEPFIEIKSLNQDQRAAVYSSFNNPLTVVTGPPGSGKSQVVQSIIANAITNKHSVIFASKNNKAVDVVKERLDELINEQYIFRFGSKEDIRSNTKPILERHIAKKSQDEISNKEKQLSEARERIIEDIKRKEYLIGEINRIPDEILRLATAERELILAENELATWINVLEADVKHLFIDANTPITFDWNYIGYLIKKTKSKSSNSFSKFLFNIFQKKNHLEEIKKINASLDIKIYDYVSKLEPYIHPNKEYLESTLSHLQFLYKLPSLKEKIQAEHLHLKDLILQKKNTVITLSTIVDELKNNLPEFENEIIQIDKRRQSQSIELLNAQIYQNLFNLNLMASREFLSYIPTDSGNWSEMEIKKFADVSTSFLTDFNVACITNLSVKNSFPLAPEIADILIIDEASQCDIASALPLLFRCKRAVIIGDPLQLKHISTAKKYESTYVSDKLGLKNYQLNYVEVSLFDHAFSITNKSKIDSVFLAEHYRCHPKIAEFASRYIYEKQRGQTWAIKTTEVQFKFGDPGIHWINIEGEMHPNRNVNSAEASKVVDLVCHLQKSNPNASIGVVTPFRHQVEEIRLKLGDTLNSKVIVDTVYRYQGDEKDIIIFSTVITTNSSEGKAKFINREVNQLNVAITRARSSLYIVGNHNYCKNLKEGRSLTLLANLALYVESLKKLK